MKKSNIYTRTGDLGMTSLVGGERVRKNDLRVEVYGTLDELNSSTGLLMSLCTGDLSPIREQLLEISSLLFDAGSYFASFTSEGPMLPPLDSEAVGRLEGYIDAMDSQMEPFKCFLLPGGAQAAAAAHVCRTQCRRAERRVLDLEDTGFTVDPGTVRWINRLSDYFFVLARYINHLTSTPEIRWQRHGN